MDGILVERYVAGAHYNKYKQLGMELGTLITFPYNLGMQAPYFVSGRNGESCTTFKKCVLEILDQGKLATVSFSRRLNAVTHAISITGYKRRELKPVASLTGVLGCICLFPAGKHEHF